MTEPVDCCSRCGLPIIGTPSYVLMECEEQPPKQPELWLCQPCMASLNRWLLHRQREAKDLAARSTRDGFRENPERQVRRRRTREWHENRLKQRMRKANIKEALSILQIVLVVGGLIGVFGAFVAIFMTSGQFIRKR